MDMNTVLLHTKVRLPSLRSDRVRRERLFQQLDSGLQARLILVSAPAGFGKTTLVSAWIQERGLAAAWLSLEKDDNDPARFWSYFISALQPLEAQIEADLLAGLRADPAPPDQTRLAGLINAIDQVRQDFVFVLDDYHVIEDARIHDGMLFLLEHLPPRMRLLICTRLDPPWPLARLRGRGEICELRGQDLRFTLAETGELMNSILELDLASEDILRLEARTEGWVAGLQMSALSLRGQADKADRIRQFSLSQRYGLDYLLEEVLQRQPASLQDFLLKTSILERLTAPLCDALLGIDHSQELLQQIEAANLFLLPLDDERRWYRYHSLFAELLRSSLAQKQPAELVELHRRASRWYVENGLLSQAARHASAAGDAEFVARLIEQNALTILTIYSDQIGVLAGWLDELPPSQLQARPWLAVARAWLLAYSGELQAADPAIQQAEATILRSTALDGEAPANQAHLLAALDAIRGYHAFMQGDLDAAVGWMEKATPRLSDQDLPTRLFAAVVRSSLAALQGNIQDGIAILSDTASLWRDSHNPLLEMMALSELAGLQLLSGQLSAVVATCERAIDLAREYTRRVGLPPANIGFAHARLSYVLRERRDLAEAIKHAQEAVLISLRWGQKDCLRMSYLYLALALQAAGQQAEALRMAARGKQAAHGLSESDEAVASAYEAKIHALQGDREFLLVWAERAGLVPNEELRFSRMREYLVFGRALLAAGRLAECQALLRRVLSLAARAGAAGYEIEACLLLALAHSQQGEGEAAQVIFEGALSLAEAQGFQQIFLDEGPQLSGLLRQAARRGVCPAYARQLLHRLTEQSVGAGRPSAPAAALPNEVEALTRRELEILRCLSGSRTVAEIAAELCITPSTLRTHMRNLYAKLGAHSRIEAVAIARSLDIC